MRTLETSTLCPKMDDDINLCKYMSLPPSIVTNILVSRKLG